MSGVFTRWESFSAFCHNIIDTIIVETQIEDCDLKRDDTYRILFSPSPELGEFFIAQPPSLPPVKAKDNPRGALYSCLDLVVASHLQWTIDYR